VRPSAETAAMLFWARMASGQITMRKVDRCKTLGEKLADPVPVDLTAWSRHHQCARDDPIQAISTILATAPRTPQRHTGKATA